MEDLVKVVLHTPTYVQAHELHIQGRMSYAERDSIFELNMSDYRLTLVALVDREEFRIGVSICNTKSDQFSKKLGNCKATVRALSKPIYLSRFDMQPTKKEVVKKLHEIHLEVATHIKDYKRQLHGV